MIVISTIEEARRWCAEQRARGRELGLVPTMGYFHEGHLELMRRARRACGAVAVTLFVNPTQFGPGEDFARYPRDFDRDRALAEGVGVDALFCPPPEEMYPRGAATSVDVGAAGERLCGAFRPGHFNGVATIVLKLLNIFAPRHAYFGRKDAQQLLIVEKMARDFDLPVTIAPVDTVREKDGLAMSSRNVYLSAQERAQAPALYRSLQKAREALERGERDSSKVIDIVKGVLAGAPLGKVQYVSLTDRERFDDLAVASGEILLSLAVHFGGTRLIDNLMTDAGPC